MTRRRPSALIRCNLCFEYRCFDHAPQHDCSSIPRYYELNGKMVSKAEFEAAGPFNPPPTVSGGVSLHGSSQFCCQDCPPNEDQR